MMDNCTKKGNCIKHYQDNMVAFINHGIDIKKTKQQIISGSFAFSILLFLIGTIGLSDQFKNPHTVKISLISYLIIAVYFILIVYYTKNFGIKAILQCGILHTLTAMILFSLYAYMILKKLNIYAIWIMFIPICCGICSFCITCIRLKNCAFLKNKKSSNLIIIIPSTGGATLLGRRLSIAIIDYINVQDLDSLFAIVGLFLLLIAILWTSIGTPIILKLYCFKKLEKNSKGNKIIALLSTKS